MARVTKHPDFTNPVKSITFIPDHYVNISVKAEANGVEEYKAGQVVTVDFANLSIIATTTTPPTGGGSEPEGASVKAGGSGNAIVFVDQKVNAGEGTPVTVLIHGFVNAAKLIDADKLDPNCKQITVLGSK